jgi:hypothetical protein
MTSQTGKGNIVSNIVNVLIYLYMLPAVFVFVPYYNWQYANTHGYVSWLEHFRNELVPVIQLKVKNWEMPQNDLSIHKQIDALENKWADWFNANKDDFYILK